MKGFIGMGFAAMVGVLLLNLAVLAGGIWFVVWLLRALKVIH